MKKRLGGIIFSAALFASVASTGCAVRGEARVRYFDRDHDDWHHWDDHEDREYHRYVNDHHKEYREFNRLSDGEKQEYWNWRHSNPSGEAR